MKPRRRLDYYDDDDDEEDLIEWVSNLTVEDAMVHLCHILVTTGLSLNRYWLVQSHSIPLSTQDNKLETANLCHGSVIKYWLWATCHCVTCHPRRNILSPTSCLRACCLCWPPKPLAAKRGFHLQYLLRFKAL